jgi:hypothetical protein
LTASLPVGTRMLGFLRLRNAMADRAASDREATREVRFDRSLVQFYPVLLAWGDCGRGTTDVARSVDAKASTREESSTLLCSRVRLRMCTGLDVSKFSS